MRSRPAPDRAHSTTTPSHRRSNPAGEETTC
jgi:hypothetical protein